MRHDETFPELRKTVLEFVNNMARARSGPDAMQIGNVEEQAAKGNERRVKGPGQSQFYTIKEEDDTVSVGEYDAGKVKETLLQLGLGVCVMCVMHFKWGYVQPLMIHCLLQPSQVWDCKAVQVHLRGKEAEYPRPWKIGGGSPIEAWAQRKKEEMEAAAKEAKAEEAKKSD